MSETPRVPSSWKPGDSSPKDPDLQAGGLHRDLESLRRAVGRSARGTTDVPGSKAISQRYLAAAALAAGESRLSGLSDADDVRVFLSGLKALGIELQTREDSVSVQGLGSGRLPSGGARLQLGNNGTALRFLTALAALKPRETIIEAAPHRPLGTLLRALRSLGVNYSPDGASHAPVTVFEVENLRGECEVEGSPTSQAASALLLLAASQPGPFDLRIKPPHASAGYIGLTADTIRQFGRECVATESGYRLGEGQLQARTLAVEPDASAAAFFWTAAAITGGAGTVAGRFRPKAQPDFQVLEILGQLGCEVEQGEAGVRCTGPLLRGGEFSLRDCPDLLPPLAIAGLFSPGLTRLTGVEHTRHKESDRLEGLGDGLRALGADVEVGRDFLQVRGTNPGTLRGCRLDPRGDHRLAMAWALVGLRVPGVSLHEPECVAKSDPHFFGRLAQLFPEDSKRASGEPNAKIG